MIFLLLCVSLRPQRLCDNIPPTWNLALRVWLISFPISLDAHWSLTDELRSNNICLRNAPNKVPAKRNQHLPNIVSNALLLMKKLILAAITTACATSAFAQATIVFNNRVTGTILTHVYGPNAANPYLSRVGNGPTDTPAGVTDWAGFTLIGTTGGLQSGGIFASLLGAPGFGVAESTLIPASGGGVTTFRTGSASGQITPTTATFNNIPPNAPQATLEMVAWDNSSGLYATWTAASVAWKNGIIAAGTSGTWNQDYLGGTLPAPNLINTTDPSQSVRSFNLYFVPEPTSAALLALGGAAMLILRRRK